MQITLKRRDGKNFNIEKLSASEDELDAWNLCTLVTSPHGASVNQERSQPELMECNYVVLTFKSKEEREHFALQFEFVTKRRAVENSNAALGQHLAYANEVSRLENLNKDFGSRSPRPSSISTLVPTGTAELKPMFIPPQNFNFQPLTLTPPRTPNQGGESDWEKDNSKDKLG